MTCADSGIGFETARALAAHGASLVPAVRDIGKGEQAAARIRAIAPGTGHRAPGTDVTVQELDLSSLESVRAASAALHAIIPGSTC